MNEPGIKYTLASGECVNGTEEMNDARTVTATATATATSATATVVDDGEKR